MSDYRNCFWPDPCKPVSPPSTPCYPPCPPAPCPPAPPCCPPVNNPLCVNCGGSTPENVWIPSYAFKYTTTTPQVLTNPTGPLSVAFGSGPSTSDITVPANGQGVTFSKSGIYAVWYSVSLSTAPTAGFAVALTLDGSPVAGSSFTTVATDLNYTKMAIVPVAAGQTLAITLITNPGTISVAQASILVNKIAR